MKVALPSRKFVIAISIIASIAIVIVLITVIKKNKNASMYQKYQPGVTIGEAVNRDSDGDGVLDWQESLFELDPHNPDSDGDGVGDGEEVRNQQSTLVSTTPLETDSEENKTNLLTRDLYAAISTLSNGQELDPATRENLTNLLELHIIKSSQTTEYTKQNINEVPPTQQSSGQYIASFGSIFADYVPQTNPLAVLQEATQTSDPTVLLQLQPLLEEHTTARDALLEIPVPQNAIPYHLNMINSIQHLIDDISGIGKYFEDPILTLSGVFLYNEHVEEFVQAIEEMNSEYFAQFQ